VLLVATACQENSRWQQQPPQQKGEGKLGCRQDTDIAGAKSYWFLEKFEVKGL